MPVSCADEVPSTTATRRFSLWLPFARRRAPSARIGRETRFESPEILSSATFSRRFQKRGFNLEPVLHLRARITVSGCEKKRAESGRRGATRAARRSASPARRREGFLHN